MYNTYCPYHEMGTNCTCEACGACGSFCAYGACGTCVTYEDEKCGTFVADVVVRQLLSLYFRFYKVIMLESTNATGEGKNASVFLDVRLRS